MRARVAAPRAGAGETSRPDRADAAGRPGLLTADPITSGGRCGRRRSFRARRRADRLDVRQALADDHPSTTTGRRPPPEARRWRAARPPSGGARPRLAARLEAAAVADVFGLDGPESRPGRCGRAAPGARNQPPQAPPGPRPAIRRPRRRTRPRRCAAARGSTPPRPSPRRDRRRSGGRTCPWSTRPRSSRAGSPRRTRDLEAVDPHRPRRRRHRLPGAHAGVRAPAVDLDGRRGRHRLDHVAGHAGRGGEDRVRIGRGAGRRRAPPPGRASSRRPRTGRRPRSACRGRRGTWPGASPARPGRAAAPSRTGRASPHGPASARAAGRSDRRTPNELGPAGLSTRTRPVSCAIGAL